MNRQDESYLDSLLDTFSKEAPSENVPERRLKKKKESRQGDDWKATSSHASVSDTLFQADTISFDDIPDQSDTPEPGDAFSLDEMPELGDFSLDDSLDLDDAFDLDSDLEEALGSLSSDDFEVSFDEQPAEEPMGELSFDELPSDEPMGELSFDELPSDEPMGELSFDEQPVEEPMGELSFDEQPMEEPMGELSFDGQPADEPAGELSFDELPSDEPMGEFSFDEPQEEAATGEIAFEEASAEEMSFDKEDLSFGEALFGETSEENESMEEDPFSLLDFMSGMEDVPGDPDAASIGMPDMEAGETSEDDGKGKKRRKKEKGEKKGSVQKLFQKLFANVPVEEKEGDGSDLLPEEVRQKEAAAKEEQKAKKAADKAAKKEEAKQAKEAAKKEKDAKKRAKQEEKQSKKKEIALKEMKESTEEETVGRINRIGAVLVFSFFLIIAGVILIGSSGLNYDISVRGAEREFSLQHYNKAYYQIRGIEVKPKDMEIHDKIMTVMYVNKQLNSYNNYYGMEDYPNALDSLLKGLERYDKYLALARELGIESDLNYVRNQILAELERVYGLKERDAVNMTELQNKTEYSARVYEVAALVQDEKEEVEYIP